MADLAGPRSARRPFHRFSVNAIVILTGTVPAKGRTGERLRGASVVDLSLSDSGGRSARLHLPLGVRPYRIAKGHMTVVVTLHALAALALLPWLFSWTGLILMVAGIYLFGMLGINIGYHRLLTHRGFVSPKWFEYFLGIVGCCNVQDSPARWVAAHRKHHQHSDEQDDPHSPLVNFLWGHMGWLVVKNGDLWRPALSERFAKDLMQDPFYVALDRYQFIPILLSWSVFFVGGVAAELLRGGNLGAALQFGASLLVWGVFVRTVVVWHITWSVNSLTHMWGYRSYQTNDDSRNNALVGFLAGGEGWHNNHHADPRSARHGHAWWEVDLTYLTILLLAKLGLARDVVKPNARVLALRAARLGNGKVAMPPPPETSI
jgi:sn-1 stearoyl-lipid 9-desaturase